MTTAAAMSPARLALAWVDAGARWAAAADQAGLSVIEVGDLVLARELTHMHLLQLEHGVQLLSEDAGCRLHRCEEPVHHRRLCVKHYSRLYKGRPLLGPQHVLERSCGVCGARWCPLPDTTSQRKLCGDPACLSAVRARARTREQDAKRAARDAAIMEQIRSGEQYRQIARQFGLSEPRIGKMARAAGIHRYRQRVRADVDPRT